MAPEAYYRKWDVYLRGERIGEVLAATHDAACARAIQRFKIKDEDREDSVKPVCTSLPSGLMVVRSRSRRRAT